MGLFQIPLQLSALQDIPTSKRKIISLTLQLSIEECFLRYPLKEALIDRFRKLPGISLPRRLSGRQTVHFSLSITFENRRLFN